MEHYLLDVVRRQKLGVPVGVYSVCSAHELVLEASMEQALGDGTPLLIEATSNQVNQFGGYTGMRPADFRRLVMEVASRVGFPSERLILGGDHLGPNPWQNEPAEVAMAKAETMVREYAQAGFSKIHLDASMFLADDPGDRTRRLDSSVIADRSVRLCQAAEAGYQEWHALHSDAPAPVYVIGSEVPIPGGSQEPDEGLSVTDPEDLRQTIALHEQAFAAAGLTDAFRRVVGVVVQPGVEFGDASIHEYDRVQARPLTKALTEIQGVVFEGHSTDYQTRVALKEMVEDGVAILKVGPGLTFAMREALFALSYIEEELLGTGSHTSVSRLRDVLEQTMIDDPSDWIKYYHGSDEAQRIARKYSLSDRSRYYWGREAVRRAVESLVENLRRTSIPLGLLSQFLPGLYADVRAGRIEADPLDLVKARVRESLRDYAFAVTP